MTWREAVLEAIKRYTKRHDSTIFNRQEFLDEELDRIVQDTASIGQTPNQTVSRVLQELRDNNDIEFIDNVGTYRFLAVQGRTVRQAISKRQFGSIPNYQVGSLFANRIELSVAGVHRPPQAGISGKKTDGADSIVLNGGYVDDEDYGDVIVYTGHGGQDGRGKQVRDQDLSDSGNWALKISYEQQLPLRVIRGPNGDPQWSPSSGYRYDGLYLVVRYWPDKGIDGYRIWRYRLERIDQSAVIEPTKGGPVGRTSVTSDRQIRDSALAQKLKEEYDFTCQICGTRLDSPSGPYAEAAHIKPLGRPDDGPDVKSNMLCLCPNHHKLMDCGGVVIDDSYRIIQVLDGKQLGILRMSHYHRVSQEYLSWHRRRWLQA